MDNKIAKKRGAPKGRRPLFWICSGIIDSKLVCEKFAAEDHDPDSVFGSFSKQDVIKKYKEKYNVDPEIVYGPLYEKRMLKNMKVKKMSICRNISKIRLRPEQKSAIFDGWKGIANYIENNNDKALFVFLSEVSPNKDKKREAPRPGTVNISDLEFISE